MQDHPVTEQEFWSILRSVPEPVKPFYRLYYDEHGHALFYSMEAVAGNYIEITPEQFAKNDMLVRVVDKKIVPMRFGSRGRLVQSDHGTPCHPNNVAIVVPETQPHQKWINKIYED